MDEERLPGPSGDQKSSFAARSAPGLQPGQVVVSVTGDIDLNSETRLREALTQLESGPPRRVIVDLSGVEFMASAGIHVLLDVGAALRSEGGLLIIACARPVVARVLTLTGADQLVPVAGTVADALAWP